MEQWELVPELLMYLSGYLKQHQALYCPRLSAVPTHTSIGNRGSTFFLSGVETAAAEAVLSIVTIAARWPPAATGCWRRPGQAR